MGLLQTARKLRARLERKKAKAAKKAAVKKLKSEIASMRRALRSK